MLMDEIYKKIKEEITNDPEKIGYAGKTDKEIAILLSSSIRKERMVTDDIAPPLNRILVGIADALNIVTDIEVAQAKLVKEI